MKKQAEAKQKGLVGVLLSPTGAVIASVAEYEAARPGLGQLEKVVTEALAHRVVSALASPLMAQSVDTATAESVMQSMIRNGCAKILIPIDQQNREV